MIVQTIPADSQLYNLAQEYLNCIIAMRRGVSPQIVASLDIARYEAHAAFENALLHNGIEFYDKQNVFDIACEIASYHAEGGF